MKVISAVFLLFLILTSCEKRSDCWQCKSVVYGKDITEVYCGYDIEDYKARMMQFYDGGMTSIECVMIPKTEE